MLKRKKPPLTAREFIAEKVLPEIIDLPPEKWIPKMKEISSELPSEEKKRVRRAGLGVLRRRKEIVEGVIAAVEEVRSMASEDGRPYGDVFKGVVFIGTFTGRSYGEVSAKKTLNPDEMGDLDVFPVVTYGCPKRVREMKVLGERVSFIECDDALFGDLKGKGDKLQGSLGIQLEQKITDKTGIHCAVNVPITVAPDDPGSTLRDIELLQSHLRFFEPREWHFVGDSETGRLFAERVRELKRSP